MSKKLIVANWKNHPQTLAEAEAILDSVDGFLGSLNEKELSLVFCPPFVFLEEVSKVLGTSHLEHNSELGAQDVAVDDVAAATGEITGVMLKKLGVRYVIIGHSERRWKVGESDEVVNKKLKAALKNELIPVVCLGEKARQTSALQNSGGQVHDWKDFLREQTEKTFAGLTPDDLGKCLIAYEPVWAISTTPGAKPDTPHSALESIAAIRDTLNSKFKIQNLKFLYGGSVTSANVREFLKEEDMNGVLVGGASVNKEEFVKILSIAAKL